MNPNLMPFIYGLVVGWFTMNRIVYYLLVCVQSKKMLTMLSGIRYLTDLGLGMAFLRAAKNIAPEKGCLPDEGD